VIGAWTESSCRPPWFETTIASTPASTASRASSAVMRPLTSNGTGAASRIHARSSHVRSGANVCSSDRRPIGIWKPLRVSRWRKPLSGKSTVRQTASNPTAWTRCSMSTVNSRSVKTYSCHHFGASEAAATSSRRSNAVLETTMTVPARAAPRAVASSPSGCARSWYAHGATSTGTRSRCRDRGRRVDGPGPGQHPRADHPVLERAAVLRQGPLVPGAARRSSRRHRWAGPPAPAARSRRP
jgi:hypothetical protein